VSEWQETTLGDVITLQRGHDLAKTEMQFGSIPVAGSNGVIGYHNKATTKALGITIGRSGNIGNPHLYKEDFWAHNTTLYVKDFKGNDEIFVFYLLKSIDFAGFNVGSAVPTLNRNHIHPMVIKKPTPKEQKAIASVLSSLDDKIDLLHRQNTTLERMAETLFRQWFVEEAQENWEEKPLSSIANFLNGLACQKSPPTDAINKLPVLKIKELSSGISENSDWATSNVKPEYIVENGDVIFAWSASLMVKVWDGEKCVLNQHLFKVTSQEFPKWFYLHWCKDHLDEFISISSSHATTMGHIKRGDLDTAMVKVPKPHELALMTEQMTPLLEKQIINSKQIKTLEKLRDNLLPKLMSGDVRVEA
jgi:type I restriction enzyme S subunit